MARQQQLWTATLCGLFCGVAIGCGGGMSQPSASPLAPTNTSVNARDQQDTAKTPIDQNENEADVATTADIRKQVVASQLSVNGHNVKIITQNGKVTLRGPVASTDEKKTIADIATSVAGAGNVDDQLEVAP